MNRREAIRWGVWALLLLVVVVAYSTSLWGEFTYDDKVEVVGNKTIRVLDEWRLMLEYNLSRPVTIATYALNYHFSERAPFAYHAVDVVIFGLEVGLAFLLFSAIAEVRKLARPVLIGGVTAALWAAHPLNTEAVSYVTGRSEQLVALFYLLGCWSFVRWRQVGGLQHFVGAWVAVVLGAFTKEVAVTMPVAFLLIELVLFRDMDWRQVRWRDHVPSVVGIAAFFGLRVVLYDAAINPIAPQRDLDLQLWTQAEVWVRYVQLSVVPYGQSVFHDHPETGASLGSIASMIFVVGASIYALVKARQRPLLAFAWLWFALTLLPSSSFVALKETMAEHRVHLSLLGVCFVGALAVARLEKNAIWGAVGLTGLLVAATVTQNRAWQTEVALWGQATARNAESAEAWYGFGDALHLADEHGQAREAYNQATSLDPAYLEAWNNLGREQAELGNRDEAEAAWKSALKASPSYCKAHNNLGMLYGRGGRYKEAEVELRTSLSYCPNACLPNRLLGEIYAERLGEPDRAVAHYEAFLDRCGDDVYASLVRDKLTRLTW